MATNPPITIGPFTNVPAPGSGVKSDWAQQITNYVLRTAWTQLPFAGTWTNFGGGYAAAQYRKVGDTVQLRGLCTGSTAAALGTLPAGFRPAYNVQMLLSSAAGFVVLTITASTGALALTGTIGANVSLEGVQFSTSVT